MSPLDSNDLLKSEETGGVAAVREQRRQDAYGLGCIYAHAEFSRGGLTRFD